MQVRITKNKHFFGDLSDFDNLAKTKYLSSLLPINMKINL